jgi:hypothetical protein
MSTAPPKHSPSSPRRGPEKDNSGEGSPKRPKRAYQYRQAVSYTDEELDDFGNTLLLPQVREEWNKMGRRKQRNVLIDAAQPTPTTELGAHYKQYLISFFTKAELAQLEEDDAQDEFVRGEILLKAVTTVEESFGPNPNDPTAAQYFKRATELQEFYKHNKRYKAKISSISTNDLAADLFSPDSKYRGIILQLARLNDQVALSHPDRDRTSDAQFRSLAPDRCWPSSRVGRVDPNVKLITLDSGKRSQSDSGKRAYQIRLHTLSLVEKVSGDLDTLSKLSKVDEKTGRLMAQGAEYETSHLCNHTRGGSFWITPGQRTRVISNCYNPAHLVAESHDDNTLRINCPGKTLINGRWVNLCRHGTIESQKRCLGTWENTPDLEVSRDQHDYIPLYQSREEYQQAKANLAASTPAGHQNVRQPTF